MDWGKFAENWGPAIPMFFVLVWLGHQLVHKEIPRGFRRLERTLEREEKRAEARHDQHMRLMVDLRDTLAIMYSRSQARAPAKKKTPKKKASRASHPWLARDFFQ